MERLTMTDAEMRGIGPDFDCPVNVDNDGVISDFCDRVCDDFQNNCPFQKMAERLKEYEDAEEQGLFYRKPFNEGDRVYLLYATGLIGEKYVDSIEIGRTNDAIHFHDGSIFTVWNKNYEDLKKCCFLTKEAAEAALAEMGE